MHNCILVFSLLGLAAALAPLRSMPHIQQVHSDGFSNEPDHPSTADCTWKTFNQTLDHFNTGVTVTHGAHFSQRYCIVDKYWRSPSEELVGEIADLDAESLRGPIFFYTGNESPVEEYINNTGLIWELAPKYGALIIFAEHRYEGESVPAEKNIPNCLSYCSSTQALADYATLIDALKVELKAEKSPVIAFGGSYGGMLSSWLRFKYPNSVDGAIAASAPIWGFPRTTSPIGLDGAGISISRGVSAAGGATDMCHDNLKFAWPLIRAIGNTAQGRSILSETFKLCRPLSSSADVDSLIAWGNSPWFNLAEGNYPFASTYITFAVGPGLYPLPPWPMRVACKNLNKDFGLAASGDVSHVNYSLKMGPLSLHVDWDKVTTPSTFSEADIRASGAIELLSGVRDAVGVWFNITADRRCYDVGSPAVTNSVEFPNEELLASDDSSNVCTSTLTGSWGPLCCNDNLNLINYVVMGVGNDIFWPPTVAKGTTIEDIVNRPGSRTGCGYGYAAQGLYGVPNEADPWSNWMTTYYGGRTMRTHSNVVFSNGLIDPWSSAGVYPSNFNGSSSATVQNITADGSIVSVILPLGGHHLDLFFSTPQDPPCAFEARKIEEMHIKKWITEAYENNRWE